MELHLDKMLERYQVSKKNTIDKRRLEIAKAKAVNELNKIIGK